MTEGFQFHSPWFLGLALLLIPVFWVILKSSKIPSIQFSSLSLVKNFRQDHSRVTLSVLKVAALLCLILALSRPQTGRTLTEINTDAVDITLVLDTSGSMQALDFMKEQNRVTRLDAVKDVVAEFIKNRPQDRIGMVVFGEHAFTQCPQTLDHGVLLSFLKQIEIGMAGDKTAIGSAIGIAIKRLKDLKSKSKIIILLTDGEDNAGYLKPLPASEIAKSLGIKIYTIGVGSNGKAPFLVQGFFGRQLVYQDVTLDEKTLKEIAGITGGQYFNAQTMESLKSVYEEINQMERTEVKLNKYTDYKELFSGFAGLGLFFLLTEVFLAHTFLRRIP